MNVNLWTWSREDQGENISIFQENDNLSEYKKESFLSKLYEELEAWMEGEKAYLRQGLSLRDMADQLRTNTTYLSRAINEVGGENVSRYINTKRIDDFMSQLDQNLDRSWTLGKMAKNCGFGSLTTFSRAFKEIKGLPPSEFVKKYLEDSNGDED